MAENQEVDEQELARRREALHHYQRHVHELPCATDCSIFGVPNPVDGDKWMLQRFILAQDEEHTYDRALAEMASVKITDWIWFVFPQIWGLATKPTPTSTRYALRRGGEAHAYAAHPVLFSRLVAACEVLLSNERALTAIMPKEVDRLKLRSSMTLFEAVASNPAPFTPVLQRYFEGERDERTIAKVVEGELHFDAPKKEERAK